ncbi:MAG: DUF3426 domain-containing protein [Wenzhouxiangella sp.]|nr:MAG: DUF3426 domain-containing protein [Wenzhouxiangella sp.]
MYARCPACQSVYPLAASSLAEAAGTVRCGNCGKTFNALAELFEEHPAADQQPLSGGGIPPLLEKRSTVQPELPGVSLDNTPSMEAPVLYFADSDGNGPERWPWVAATLALSLALAIQLFIYRGHPDFGLAWPGQAEPLPVANADRIQVLTRDLHRHPSLDDAIIISLTLGNPGTQTLAWPILEVRLFDPTQQVLGVRRLQPADYLDRPERIGQGMPPDLIVPVIVEFVVGSTEPSGFDFRFF